MTEFPAADATVDRVEPRRRDPDQEFAGTGRGQRYLTHGQLVGRPVLRECRCEQAESSAAEPLIRHLCAAVYQALKWHAKRDAKCGLGLWFDVQTAMACY